MYFPFGLAHPHAFANGLAPKYDAHRHTHASKVMVMVIGYIVRDGPRYPNGLLSGRFALAVPAHVATYWSMCRRSLRVGCWYVTPP